MPTSRQRLVLIPALLALLAAHPSGATDPAATLQTVAPDAPDASDVPGRTTYAPTRTRDTSPLAAELRAAEAEYAVRERALRDQVALASGDARVALLRELEQLRRARPARLAEVQLRHARRRGDLVLVARLERRLATLRAAGVAPRPEGGAR